MIIREKITECPLSSECDCNCFDPLIANLYKCVEYYTKEEMSRYLAFIFGLLPPIGEPEERGENAGDSI